MLRYFVTIANNVKKMSKIMNNTQLTIFKAASNISTKSLLIQLCLVTVSFFLTVTSAAATNENSTQDYKNSTNEYVDSVHQWGAWGLDIEPAAGGLQAPAAQALKTRNAKVRLRTNSIAALAPQRPETITRAPAPLPVTPPAPVMPTVKPTVPSITPINPRIPVPVGGPGDGF
jgi:hypothetical protein